MFTKNSFFCRFLILLTVISMLVSFDSASAATNKTVSSTGNGMTTRDIVLVIDTTMAMAYQTSGDPLNGNDAGDDPHLCNISHTCQPMENIKSAALDFIDLLSFPSDRVGIVTITDQAAGGTRTVTLLLPLTDDYTTVYNALENIKVFEPPVCVIDPANPAAWLSPAKGPCLNYAANGTYLGTEAPRYRGGPDLDQSNGTDYDFTTIPTSNIGGTFLKANDAFLGEGSTIRNGALPVVIALISGPANATGPVAGHPAIAGHPDGICPGTTWDPLVTPPNTPKCRDSDLAADGVTPLITRHSSSDPLYDADDFARDSADFIADPVNGNGIVIFTIGLGTVTGQKNSVRNSPVGLNVSGENLLKYAAEIAGDSPGIQANHGFYAYAEDPALQLGAIFSAIANNTLCSNSIVVANNHDAGAGSLRQAILEVCSSGTITFDPSLSGGTIYLASSLFIDKGLAIDGSGLASHIKISGDTENDGTGDVSVFQIGGSSSVELNGLDIVNGAASGTSGGGGIANYGTLTVKNSTVSGNSYTGGIGGGGIYNKGELTIIDSTLAGNSAKDGGDGGGIFNEYTHKLNITGSIFSDNNAALFGDGFQGTGGGIANIGTLSVDDSTFLDNDGYGGGGAIFNGINGISTIKNSSFTSNSVFGYGLGGAIHNYEGTMIIENCTFANNSEIGIGLYGGAVYNEDQMSITGSIFTGNSSSRYGGGIANLGVLTVTNSSLSNNSADLGGGIANYGNLTITNSNISENSAITGGGGVLNNNDGILTVVSSTISNNSADSGGGIINLSSTGIVNISSSTLSGNSANSVSGTGGGISNFGTLTATNSTLFGNSAASGGGITNNFGTLGVTNSIISGNSALNNGGGIFNGSILNYANTIIANSTSGEDCFNEENLGVINTNIHNLVENNAASPNQCGMPSLTDEPHLGSLSDNGGSTLTMSLLPGSPAIDAGDDAICAASPVSNASQNGVARPQGAHCDIGAFELEAYTLTVTSTHGTVAKSPNQATYHEGDVVQLTAIPDAGWVFVNWTGGLTGAANPDSVTIYGNTSATANYASNNQAPTDITISNSSVAENQAAGTTIGMLSSTDPNPGNIFTYSLISGAGSADNTAFMISGNALETAYPFNATFKNNYSVRIRTTDQGGLYFEKVFTITVTDRPVIFADVSDAYWANSYIERLYNAGTTGGCSTVPLNYCPDATVTRAQMAVFLLKGMHGSSYTPPEVGVSTGFNDVPTDYWAAAWIKQLAAEGITGGCGSGNYCPDATVTRAQMAVFLLKAKHGIAFTPPASTGVFTDVPVGYWADKWIEQLASEGITGGCGTGIYCPDSSVTRAQMAVFLVKTFGLP